MPTGFRGYLVPACARGRRAAAGEDAFGATQWVTRPRKLSPSGSEGCRRNPTKSADYSTLTFTRTKRGPETGTRSSTTILSQIVFTEVSSVTLLLVVQSIKLGENWTS